MKIGSLLRLVSWLLPLWLVGMSPIHAADATYRLTIQKNGSGSGTVTITRADNGSQLANCIAFPCTADIAASTEVKLIASAGVGTSFTGWSGACTGTPATCTLTMSQARNVGVYLRVVAPLTIVKNGSGNGSVAISGVTPAVAACTSFPCTRPFVGYPTITLTANAGNGTLFTGWSGACSGTEPTCTIAMNQARNVGVYLRVMAPLTIMKNGSGIGSVAISGVTPAVAACTSFPCTRPFVGYPTITLTANAGAGTLFTGWSGACSGTEPTCTVAMNQARNVGVYLRLAIPLTVNRIGSGNGSVSIAGSTPAVAVCTNFPCVREFAGSPLVTLTASPAAGSTFLSWGGACTGNGNTCQVLMSQSRNVTVHFGTVPVLHLLTVQTSGSGTGKLTSSPAGINCGTTCSASFVANSTVTLTATTTGAGSVFTGWTGACSGIATCTVTMTAAQTVGAVFVDLGDSVRAISAGNQHTCSLSSAGAVRCWGENAEGQIGDGTTTNRLTPVDVSGLSSGVLAISAGAFHTCALTGSGAVLCWGADGTGTTRLTPAVVTGLSSGVKMISAGSAHTCALTNNGTVRCWGSNAYGQLGDGTTIDRSTPVGVFGLSSGAKAISSGSWHTCALNNAGAARCWGNNTWGQLGDGTTEDRLTPVQVAGPSGGMQTISAGSGHTCALTSDDVARCWGLNNFGQLGDGTTTNRSTPTNVSGLSSVVQAINAGGSHACALTGAGAVRCWGSNAWGQIGDGTMTNRLVPAEVYGQNSGVQVLSMGGWHSCALTGGGAVRCWGMNLKGQLGDDTTTTHLTPIEVHGLSSGAQAISVGNQSTCALISGGAVRCWGWNDYGQLGDGTTTSRNTPVTVSGLSSGVQAISSGGGHTCALTSEGAVRCWGWNGFGQLGDGTTTSRFTPVVVSGLSSGVRAISLGDGFSCALTTDGEVRCWGRNFAGELGDGTTLLRLTPVSVSGLSSGVRRIDSGSNHSCAVVASGAVRCWGSNGQGELGDGTTTNALTPVEVIGLSSGTQAISAGVNHTCALTSGGAVRCWGGNYQGQLGDGTTTTRFVPITVSGLSSNAQAISAGSDYTCALLNGGAVRCWGSNVWGQLGDGTTTDRHTPVSVSGLTSGVDAISASAKGGAHTCALTSSGLVHCWGLNNQGQLGDGTTTINRVIPITVYGLSSSTQAVNAGRP